MRDTVVDMHEPNSAGGSLPPWWIPFIVLLVIVVLQAILFVTVIEVGRGADPDGFAEETRSGYLALYSVLKNAIVFVVLWVAIRHGGWKPRTVLRLEEVPAGEMAAACLLVLALVPWEAISWDDSGPERIIALGGLVNLNGALVVSWVSTVFLAPVGEELFFRGFALKVLGRRSVIAGVLGSCALFGIYHFNGSVGSVIAPLPFALATTYCVVVTRSVFPGIVAHALWNVIALGVDHGFVAVHPTRWMLLGSSAVGVVCVLLLLRVSARNKLRSVMKC